MEHTDEILNEIQELANKSCGEYLLDCSLFVLDLKIFGPFYLSPDTPPPSFLSLLRCSFFCTGPVHAGTNWQQKDESNSAKMLACVKLQQEEVRKSS